MSAASDPKHCLFCRIVRGELPASRVYEDDDILAFRDIHPLAPVHLLLIPKAHVATMYEADMRHHQALGKMMAKAGDLARSEGALDGFRAIINTGRVGLQEVYHVHMHVIGGSDPLGPMLSRRT